MRLAYDPHIKRLFDIGLALAALLVLAGPMLLVGLMVRFETPGPVLFRQTRIGRGGRPFTIHKFRSMTVRPDTGRGFDPGDVSRVTTIGRVLRRTKCDELPQLLNVLAGSMSLVGPRPETPDWLALYKAQDRARLLRVLPGLTDYASLRFFDEERLLAQASDPRAYYLDRIIPLKARLAGRYAARLAGRYAARLSFTTDISIIAATLVSLFRRKRRRRPMARAKAGRARSDQPA